VNSWRSGLFWAFILLVLVWIFAVYGAFYLVQKPFDVPTALGLGNTLINLAAALWILLLGGAAGRRVLTQAETLRLRSGLTLFLGENRLPAAELNVFGIGIGLGLLALATFALGLAGFFYDWLFYALAILLTILWRDDVRALGAWLVRDGPRALLGQLPRPLVAYLVLTWTFSLVAALAPPTSWDALAYHLTGPKLALQAHRLEPNFTAPHFQFPFLIEMLFALAMLLKGDVVAQLVHWVYGPLTLGAIYLLARKHLSINTAIWSVAIAASMPMLALLSSWAYTDVALAFYTFVAVAALVESQVASHKSQVSSRKSQVAGPQSDVRHETWDVGRETWDVRRLTLSGVFAGLSLGIKYTSFVVPLTILLLILWHRRREVRTGLREMVIFGVSATLVASPWYLKNWLATGNPVYPFLFGGAEWDALRAAWYQRGGTGIGWNVADWLALPWMATLGYRDANYYDGRTGPVFLMLVPLMLILAWLNRKDIQPRPVRYLLFAAGLQYLFWMLGVIYSASLWQSRLLLPALVLLSPVAGQAVTDLGRWARPQFSVQNLVALVIGLALGLNIVSEALTLVVLNPVATIVGRESQDAYLTRALGNHYRAMKTINQTLPASARVLFLWEPRTYYSQRPAQPDILLDNFARLLSPEGNLDAAAVRLRAQGFTHVLIYQRGARFIAENSPDLYPAQLPEFESRYLRAIYQDAQEDYTLYEWQ